MDQGLIKSLGVSNFRVEDLESLVPETRHPICVNQIECHPRLQQPELEVGASSVMVSLSRSRADDCRQHTPPLDFSCLSQLHRSELLQRKQDCSCILRPPDRGERVAVRAEGRRGCRSHTPQRLSCRGPAAVESADRPHCHYDEHKAVAVRDADTALRLYADRGGGQCHLGGWQKGRREPRLLAQSLGHGVEPAHAVLLVALGLAAVAAQLASLSKSRVNWLLGVPAALEL